MRLLPCLAASAFAVVCCALSSTSSAQMPNGNNPYQGLETSKPIWPPFYKPDPKDGKYSRMLNDGWCKPTGKRAREYYLSKLVDVNKLPEFSFEGKVESVENGAITAVNARNGERLLLMIHDDPTISRVNVHGKVAPALLHAGSCVQFVGRVDAAGMAVDSVDRIELITPGLVAPTAIETNKLQTLAGKVVRRDGERLILLTTSAKRHRLTIELAPDVEVSAHFTDYRLAEAGNPLKFQGRILRSSVPGQTFCFADDLDVVTDAPAAEPKIESASATVTRRSN